MLFKKIEETILPSKVLFPYYGSLSVLVMSLSRVQLCYPMDCSLIGFSVHGIFQAKILEWVAISFSSLCFRGKDNCECPQI